MPAGIESLILISFMRLVIFTIFCKIQVSLWFIYLLFLAIQVFSVKLSL